MEFACSNGFNTIRQLMRRLALWIFVERLSFLSFAGREKVSRGLGVHVLSGRRLGFILNPAGYHVGVSVL